MGLTAKDTGGGERQYDPTPEGLHLGICIAVYDLGTQHLEMWDKDTHQVRIVWELPEHRIQFEQDGEQVDMPRGVTKTTTLSLHEKATLRKLLTSWRGKSFTEEELRGFDLKKILGVSAQVQVIHRKSEKTGNIYSDVFNVLPAPKDRRDMKPENPIKFFSFEEYEQTQFIPEGIPEKTLETIKNAYEYKGWPEKKAETGNGMRPHLVRIPAGCKFGTEGEYMDVAFCEDKICNKTCQNYKNVKRAMDPIPF